MPWRVTGMMTSTSARAISVRSAALSMRRNAGFWETPGFTTILRRTPEKSTRKTYLFQENKQIWNTCLFSNVRNTVIFFFSIRALHKQCFGWIGIWLLPYPCFFAFHIQLANLKPHKNSTNHTLSKRWHEKCFLYHVTPTRSGIKWFSPSP